MTCFQTLAENQLPKKTESNHRLPEVIGIRKKEELILDKKTTVKQANDNMQSSQHIPNFSNTPPAQTMDNDKLVEREGLSMADLLESEMSNEHKNDNKQQLKSKDKRSEITHTVDDFDFDEASFLAALDHHQPIGIIDRCINGIILNIESDGIYIDIGGKAPAFMPKKECGLNTANNLKDIFTIGSQIEAVVIREQNAEGIVTISYKSLITRRSWDTIQALKRNGELIQVRVTGSNRGGLICDYNGIRGFIPYSQLQYGETPEKMIGTTITASFLEVNSNSQKLVLSAKGAVIASKLANLEVGQLIEGHIMGIKPYGFFVDLGGISGLLHHSAITNGNLKEPEKLFGQNDQVKALITELDPSRKRIALNTALLEAKPGEILTAKETVMNEATNRTINARQLMRQQEQSTK
ncbi:30S ribosomal protein S1-like B, putative (chromatophore) [Paulinella micropora]|uniref:30S ribosomal protein S1-like B, putative n=1 Tax=Paulinella micropora TaxID=1928728 RepID=A0A1L5YD75_9EUKA|nr:putative 30S ribosomal protein S1-like B [Paulinella micropora]AQX45406.1 putative 30S ribosomal protein S1-like B [Paulinella micropora]BBL86626.1 30S ribosomal protein S1-like B, putative [Paulinella micropora]